MCFYKLCQSLRIILKYENEEIQQNQFKNFDNFWYIILPYFLSALWTNIKEKKKRKKKTLLAHNVHNTLESLKQMMIKKSKMSVIGYL